MIQFQYCKNTIAKFFNTFIMAVNSDVLRVCVHLGEIGTFRKHDMYKRQYKMGI